MKEYAALSEIPTGTAITNNINTEISRFPFFVKALGLTDDINFGVSSVKGVDYHDYFLIYNLSGLMEFTDSTGYTTTVKEKDILFISCKRPFRITASLRRNNRYIYVGMAGNCVQLYYNMVRSRANCYKVTPLSVIEECILELFNLDYDDVQYATIASSSALHRALAQVYEIYYGILNSKRKVPVRDVEVKRILTYIRENFSDRKLTLEKICQEACLSKYHFCRIFKEQTGYTISSYLNQCRIYKAKELLTYSKMTVDSISTAVGYSNPITFFRNFKKETMMTPGEYRR